mmetsp:Transcript_71353/g.202403  ORF Transcript_71353/g.202403 Transcript_71353/m.202403 type:complete len:594 (-) Transcript_71353:41-1822(-)
MASSGTESVTAAESNDGGRRHYAVACAFVCTWVPAGGLATSVCMALSDHYAYGLHTWQQISLAIALCILSATWAAAEVAAWTRQMLMARLVLHSQLSTQDPEQPELAGNAAEAGSSMPQASVVGKAAQGMSGPSAHAPGGQAAGKSPARPSGGDGRIVDVLRCLRASAELAVILAFVYLCDRTRLFSQSKKVHDPRQFWGLWCVICVAALCTIRQAPNEKALQRDQTDEWKGWMQLMFLMYHYFAEKEVYNAIRVYIAAYVWMTGYGNFCLYARRDAFTLRRLLHTLFRLNFLGFCACVLLRNEYMLYYICPMHTFFTLLVMAALYVRQDFNSSRRCVYTKALGLLVLTAILYDGPAVIFRAVFGTLPIVRPLMAFHDPLHPDVTDEMHEWHFRSGLDRFIWIVGIVSALHMEDVQAWIDWVEALPLAKRISYKALATAPLAIASVCWWHYVFMLGKRDYNKLHPFTSALPLTTYLMVRNLLPALRKRYLLLFAQMGKCTLETYILQFHIWMRTTGLNGSPKFLLQWVPGSYWLNFVAVSTVYVIVSMRFFKLTAVLSDTLIRKEPRELAVVMAALVGFGAACCGASGFFVES